MRGKNEGSIYEVPGKGWRCQISLGYDKNGRPKRKVIQRQTQAAVRVELTRLMGKKDNNRPITTDKRTVEQFLKEWLEVHVKPTLGPLTYRGYESTTRLHIIPAIGRIRLDQLSGRDVQVALNKATAKGLNATAVKNINANLKTALKTAIDWQYVDRNAAKDAKPPKQKKKFKARPLRTAEADLLLNAIKGHRYEAMIFLGLMMGLRRGEVAGLCWSDFEYNLDFTSARLRVQHSLRRIPKGGQVLAGVKTADSEATVPIPRLCIDALLRRQVIQEQERIKAGPKWKQDGDFVFTSRYGARVVIEELSRELDKALALANLPHIRFHDLRHSTASLLLAKGVHMKIVQEIMRHSNFQITMDTYSHLLPSALDGAAETMNDIFTDHRKSTLPSTLPSKAQTIQ
jgi:integrase